MKCHEIQIFIKCIKISYFIAKLIVQIGVHFCLRSNEIIKIVHEKLGHPGVFKTFSYLRHYYYWHSMHRDVKKFIISCDLCQRVEHMTIAMEEEYHLVTTDRPKELIAVDFYGPLPCGRGGVQYIFVILDTFSKDVKLFPMKSATANMALKKMIEYYIPECGKPNRVLTDNGTRFTYYLLLG